MLCLVILIDNHALAEPVVLLVVCVVAFAVVVSVEFAQVSNALVVEQSPVSVANI